MKFRIGINVGDIVVRGDDLLGDGVNAAARLQALADPAEIYISSSVYEQIEGKFGFPLVALGERVLKNMPRPVSVYRVEWAADAQASPRPASPPPKLPDRPSIAVMPFQNLSDDARQEYFADGMVEEIITALSRMRGLFVIARQEHVAGRNGIDAAQPHLLHQPILQRAMGPFHAAFGLRGVGTNDVDIQRVQRPAKLGHAIAGGGILLVDPEYAMLVGVERHRLAIALQISAGRGKIIEGALALDKLQMHQPAGGIVDVDEQGALWSAALEPPVLRAINLDQLAQAIAPIPRLMHRLQPCPAILPQARRHHPLPQRLARQMNPVQLRQLLRSQRRSEVAIALPNDADDFGAQRCRITAVARPAAAAGDQGLRAMLVIGLRQPKYLTPAKPHQRCGVRNFDPVRRQILQHAHPVDLRPAHRNHRHRPNTPQLKPWRVTSLSGPTVTSLSGVYRSESHIRYYGTKKTPPRTGRGLRRP